MIKYFFSLQEEIEGFIKEHYDFKVVELPKAKASVNFTYRRKGLSEWSSADTFGKNERDFIALHDQFAERSQSIKSSFPYRLFNKIVADLVMARQHASVLA